MEYSGGGGGGGLGAILFMLVALVFALAMYVFICICAKKVCEKVGKDPGIMIWIPVVQLLPLMEVAGMQTWMIILAFIPLANIVFMFMLWLGIAKARNKGALWGVLAALPCTAIVGVPYLAFSE